ncbi:MAG: hypothetical protein HQM08_01615 [Candidatus Riflebacteria bacterium]|nr:hypothetical protein [Candidatus Riflebacteria bacterium]
MNKKDLLKKQFFPKRLISIVVVCTVLMLGNFSFVEATSQENLLAGLREIFSPILVDKPQFRLHLRVDTQAFVSLAATKWSDSNSVAGSSNKRTEVILERLGTESWSIYMWGDWGKVYFVKLASETRLELFHHGIAFVGKSSDDPDENWLSAKGMLSRLITIDTSLYGFLAILSPSSFDWGIRTFLFPQLKIEQTVIPPDTTSGPITKKITVPDSKNISKDFKELLATESVKVETFQVGNNVKLSITTGANPTLRIELASGSRGIEALRCFDLRLEEPTGLPPSINPKVFLTPKLISKSDLEKTIFSGLKRFLSIKFPGAGVVGLPEPRKVEHGELRINQGQMLVILWGTPEEMGTAHGQLLAPFIRRTLDSTIYLVGLIETVKRGKWFLDEVENAWQRTSPFIPERYVRELAAIASATPGVSFREARLSNIFPEYFHCSGFAIFGCSTREKTLFHGRCLDYMTEIGLQQAAVTFVQKPQGKFAFLNVGFAGFVGSVTGMNERQIGLGEMGGHGRYDWDGIPMTILMRRALEECETLDQVKKLWEIGPRTCEYYYVFSDGKIPDAVGVRATPSTVTFLKPGQYHELLGEGIPDTVILSGGDRRILLKKRIQEGFGKFDLDQTLHLFDRPVAMKSNLHDAVFVPQKLEAYITVADDSHPAAELPYVRYDFGTLLHENPLSSASAPVSISNQTSEMATFSLPIPSNATESLNSPH